jgi:hypothetical protein
MQSSAKTVPAYLKEVPDERKAVLKQLRDLCRLTLTGFNESMTYGMPGYSRNGVVEVGFASQRNFIALYILRTDVMRSHLPIRLDCCAQEFFDHSEINFFRFRITDAAFAKGYTGSIEHVAV